MHNIFSRKPQKVCITLKIDLTFFQEVYQEIFFIQKTNFCVLRWFYSYKGHKFSKDIFYPAVTSPKHEHEIILEIDPDICTSGIKFLDDFLDKFCVHLVGEVTFRKISFDIF